MMRRIPDAKFNGFDIYTLAVPTNDGRWSATSEIERQGASGLEVFQAFGGPFVADSEQAAKAQACIDAEQKIKDILANPT
jgi:hypothetical protein